MAELPKELREQYARLLAPSEKEIESRKRLGDLADRLGLKPSEWCSLGLVDDRDRTFDFVEIAHTLLDKLGAAESK